MTFLYKWFRSSGAKRFSEIRGKQRFSEPTPLVVTINKQVNRACLTSHADRVHSTDSVKSSIQESQMYHNHSLKQLSFFITCIFIVSFLSCSNNYFYEKTIPLKENGWLYDDPVSFDFEIQDTLKIYNLLLDIVHDKDFSKQNLYVKIHTSFPGGETIQQTLSFDFMDKKGLWHGDCSGDVCELRVYMQQGAFFNALGKHRIKIEQYMRFEPVKSIKSISLRIEDTGQMR